MPHGKARLPHLIQKLHHILRHVGEHQLAAFAQKPSRLPQSLGNVPADIEAALGQDAVKAAFGVMRLQIIPGGHVVAPWVQVDALRFIAQRL